MDPNTEETGIDPQIETEARNMGWLPKDQFKGNPDQWVDADEFVERGKHVMPLLLANNKRLQRELLTRDEKIATLAQQLNGATSAIEKIEKHYTEANKRAVENAKLQLKNELKEARANNDVDAEFEIRDKLDQLNAASDKAEEQSAATPTKAPADAPKLSPEFVAWQARNEWFGVDVKKTKAITRIGEDLRDEGNTLTGVEFLDECVRVLNEREAPAPKKSEEAPVSKVDAPYRGGRSTGRKSFADLPSEAKQACREDAEDLVGKGKRFGTMKEWEDHYTNIYFSQQ